MLKETAMVVSTSPGRAKVAIVRSEACVNCPSKSMCHSAAGGLNVLEVENPLEARPGEKVVVELRPEALVKATAMVYMLPAAAMVVGATAGWLLAGTDLGSMSGALAGLAVASSFLFLHSRGKTISKGPKISKVVSPNNIPRFAHNHNTHGFSS